MTFITYLAGGPYGSMVSSPNGDKGKGLKWHIIQRLKVGTAYDTKVKC